VSDAAAPGEPGWTPRLVALDIDGTLLRATGPRANALHRAAFTAAWEKVLGSPLDLQSIPHQGSTDPLILIKGALHAGLANGAAELMGTSFGAPAPCPPTEDASSSLAAMVREMLSHFEAAGEGAVADGLELLPGVEALLEALSGREDVRVGLVTGNLSRIAKAKIAALRVDSHFTPDGAAALLGGFGSDHCSGDFVEPWHDRAELIRIARTRAADVVRVVHIGDTPFDLRAAVAAGARAVGVCTGVNSREELEGVQGGEVVVLDDLSNTAAALEALFGEGV
jgi:phosphoglycolate phosphatase-like HAD superfamily hydrolase